MVSLQQLSFECCDSSKDFLTEKDVIAVHRRSWTVLLYSQVNHYIDFVQHNESLGLTWNAIESWSPRDHNVSKIIAILPVEVYDCFALIAESKGKSCLIVLSLRGEVLEKQDLVGVSGMLCAEIDQQKREIFVGLHSGKLLCYYLHSKDADPKPTAGNNNTSNKTSSHRTAIHITLRRQVKLKCSVDSGGSAHVPVQILSVDLLGFCLVLLGSGSVVCLSSSRFDVLFEISNSLFALRPCRLWADKFGTDFIIQSRSADGATELLEYWTPPVDYTSCEIGRFGRVAIPLHGPLMGLSLESVGVDGGAAFLSTITADQNVQLWRPMGDGTLLFEARIPLAVPEVVSAPLGSFAIKASSMHSKDTFFPGLRFQGGVFFFAKESNRLPDDQLMFVVSIQTAVCKLGVHLPSSLDNHYNNVHAEVSIALLQAEQHLLNDHDPKDVDFTAMFGGPRPAAAADLNSGYKTLDDQVSALSNDPVGVDLLTNSYMSNSLILGSEDGGGPRSVGSNEPLSLLVEGSSNLYVSTNEHSIVPLSTLPEVRPVSERSLQLNTSSTHSLLNADGSVRLKSVSGDRNDALTSRSTESEGGFSQEHVIQQLMSVHSATAEYDPLSPMASFRIEGVVVPSSRGLAAMANTQERNTVVAPETDFFVPQQMVLHSDITRSEAVSGIVRGGQCNLFQLVLPFGMVVQNNRQQSNIDSSMQVVSRHGLRDGKNLRLHQLPFQELSFKLSSMAHRAGLLCLATTMREVFVFDVAHNPEAPIKAPVAVEFEIRQSATVHTVLNADILLQHPAKLVGRGQVRGKSVLRKSDQVPLKTEVDLIGQHSLALVGDSDGKVHFAVVSSTMVCGFGMLRAHASPIQCVVMTGDAVRPMWKVGSERSLDGDHIVPISVPGSALVTMSREGEVKVWQPVFRARSSKGRSGIDKVFLTYSVDWRMSGIFVANDSPPKGLPSRRGSLLQQHSVTSGVSGTPSAAGQHPDPARKIKGVESVCLDPTCMHLLVSFKNGFLEQWAIPGLIDTGSGLATSQSACWVNSSHSDSVHHMRVYVHAPDTSMCAVDVSRDNDRRDEVIADLAAYVKGSASKTVGYTYKQLKTLTTNSSLVTSSKDLSVIVWGFAFSRTFSESSSTYLVPQPCRRFSFSSTPTHGLCYCTALNINVNFLQGSTWRLSAIVSGIVVTAYSDLRSSLFVADSAVGSEVSSAELVQDGESVHFEDDMFFEEVGGPSRAKSRLKHSLSAIPTICSVSKPSQIVTAIAAKVTNNSHKMRSWNTLDAWALIRPEEPPLCLHLDDADEQGETQAATAAAVQEQRASPTKLVDGVSASHFKKLEYSSAGDPFSDLTSQDLDPVPAVVEVNAAGLQKFVFNGIHMVADEAAIEEVEQEIRAHTPGRYSVVHPKESNPRRSMQWSPPSGDQQDRLAPLAGNHLHIGAHGERPFSTPLKRTSFAFEPHTSFMLSVNDSNISSGPDVTSPKVISQLANDAVTQPVPLETAIPTIATVQSVESFERSPVKEPTGEASSGSEHVKHIANPDLHPPEGDSPQSRRRSISISSVSFSRRGSQTVKVISLDVGVDFSKQGAQQTEEKEIRLHSQENNEYRNAAAPITPDLAGVYQVGTVSGEQPKQSVDVEKHEIGVAAAKVSDSAEVVTEQQGVASYAEEARAAAAEEVKKRLPGEEPADDLSVAESMVSALSEFSEVAERTAKSRDTRSAVLRQQSQVSKKNRLDLLVKPGEEPAYTSKAAPRPEQGVRQQLGKNAIFATIGKLGTSQKVVIQKEVRPSPKAVSRAPSHGTFKKLDEEEGNKDNASALLFDDRSFGELPSPDKEDAAAPVTAAVVEKHAVKPLSFMLDVPENKMTLKRKNAVKIVQALLPKLSDLDALEESDDDKSVISSYFDRSAPPIYANKVVAPKKRLVSKRFDPVAATPEQVAANETNKLLSGLSAEEKRLFDSLDDEAKEKLLDELKKNAKNKKGNKGAVKDLFKNISAQLAAEAAEEAQLSMDLKIEVIDVTDRSLVVSASSLVGGNVVLVMANFNESYSTPTDALYDHHTAEEVQGYLSHQCCSISANSFTEATFVGLKPLHPYIVYAIIDRSAVAHKRSQQITDDEDENQCVSAEATTLTEQLDLEWGRLSEDMRRVEIKAALRSKFVQSTALARFPPLVLPSDDDIDFSEETMQKYSAEPSGNVWFNFLRWWAGDDPVVPTAVRSDFLFQESVSAARDPKVLKLFVDQRYCSAAEIEVLSKFADDAHYVLSQGKAKRDQVAAIREFKRFRSWYKGGQVVLTREEEDLARRGRSGSVSSRGTQRSTAFTANRDSPVTVSEKVSLTEAQLLMRTAFLHSRVDEVDRCKMHAGRLVDGHRFLVANGLKDSDLMFKRSSLSGQDITAIMCSLKLTELCVAHDLCKKEVGLSGVNQALLGTPAFSLADIAKVDTFVICDADSLRPDDPPAVDLACLPGTNRKPLKAWQLCSREEKTLELTLACCLDAVLEIAIMSRVPVPDPEDVLLPPGKFPMRDKRWKEFRDWYAGEEETNPVPGKGIPTLQRVIFAETTETRNVEDDPAVLQSMVDAHIPLPKEITDKLSGADPQPSVDQVNSVVVDPQDTDSQQEQQVEEKPEPLSFESFNDSLLKSYERAASTVSGLFLRFDLLCRNISSVLTCRRISIMRLMWPPGAARLGSNYMFPRMGLLTARYQLPPQRIKLFPSRSPESYSHKEILSFYSDAMLDADDKIMLQAEKDGVKLRAYYDWLTKEKERVEEGRLDMFNEDGRSRLMRDTRIQVERQLAAQAKKMNLRAEKLDENGEEVEGDADAAFEEFHFMHAVPKEYWYIFEESCEFMHGSGVNNGDEIEEMRLEEIARANKAVEDAIKFENYLQEEKNRREMLEQERLRREEMDRRLAEGVARRRHLRDHFEELKRNRVKLAEEEARKAEQDLLEAQVQQEREHVAWLAQREIDLEAQRIVDENRLMQAEERYMVDLRLRIKETRRMTHEDIASFVREQQELRVEEVARQRFAELQELYVPFEPYQFKNSRVKKPVLHSILNTALDSNEEVYQLPPVYQEALDDARSHHSHVSNHSHDTSSSLNKRSLRYKQLYEGSGIHAPPLNKSLELSGTGEDRKPFEWSRVSHKYPEVMPLAHSPTKKHIRSGSGGGLQRALDLDWTLQRDVSPACFVLTAKQAPLRPLSGNVNRGRSMNSLGPLLDQLKDTSVFQHPATDKSKNHKESHHQSFPFLPQQSITHSVLNRPSEQLTTPRGSVSHHVSGRMPSHLLSAPNDVQLEFNDSISADEQHLRSQSAAGDAYSPLRMSGSADGSQSSNHDDSVVLQENASTFSLFRSRSDNIMVEIDEDAANRSWQPQQGQHKERSKMKELISQSAAAATALTDQKWLDMQKTQKKLMMASLSSIDSKQHGKRGRTDALSLQKESKQKLAEVARLKQELKELGIVETGTLDFKTKQLAKSASDSVVRLRLERDLLRQYVGSGAVMQDSYFMMACEPGLREKTSLETSADVQRYVQQIEEAAVSGDNTTNSQYLSDKNVVPPVPVTKSHRSLKSVGGKKSTDHLNSVSSVSQTATGSLLHLSMSDTLPNRLGIITGNHVAIQTKQTVSRKVATNSPLSGVARKAGKVASDTPGSQRNRRSVVVKTPSSSRLLQDDGSVDTADTRNSLLSRTVVDDSAFIIDALKGIADKQLEAGDSGLLMPHNWQDGAKQQNV